MKEGSGVCSSRAEARLARDRIDPPPKMGEPPPKPDLGVPGELPDAGRSPKSRSFRTTATIFHPLMKWCIPTAGRRRLRPVRRRLGPCAWTSSRSCHCRIHGSHRWRPCPGPARRGPSASHPGGQIDRASSRREGLVPTRLGRCDRPQPRLKGNRGPWCYTGQTTDHNEDPAALPHSLPFHGRRAGAPGPVCHAAVRTDEGHPDR